MEGRIEGRMSADRKAYEITVAGQLRRSIPIEEARLDARLAVTIERNGWEKVDAA